MYAIAHLGSEDVVHEPVLGEPAQALEGGCSDDRSEMLPIPGDLGAGAGDSGFDTLLELLGSRGHSPRVAIGGRRYTE